MKRYLTFLAILAVFPISAHEKGDTSKITERIVDSVLQNSSNQEPSDTYIFGKGVKHCHLVKEIKDLDREPLVKIRTKLLDVDLAIEDLKNLNYTPNVHLDKEIIMALQQKAQQEKNKDSGQRLGKGIYLFLDKYTRCTTKNAYKYDSYGVAKAILDCDCVTVLPKHEFEAIKKEIEDRKQKLQMPAG